MVKISEHDNPMVQELDVDRLSVQGTRNSQATYNVRYKVQLQEGRDANCLCPPVENAAHDCQSDI